MTDKESKRKERLIKRQKKAQKKAEKKQVRKQQPLPKKMLRFVSLAVVAVVAVIFMLASVGTVGYPITSLISTLIIAGAGYRGTGRTDLENPSCMAYMPSPTLSGQSHYTYPMPQATWYKKHTA